MTEQVVQFLVAGVVVGSIYAIVGLGWTIVHSVTKVLNFAQGEFVMLGGMMSVAAVGAGIPVALSIPVALAGVTLTGLLMQRLTVNPIRLAAPATLIVMTFAVSMVIRGTAQLAWGWEARSLPPFTGGAAIRFLGAYILPQSLWILGTVIATVAALKLLLEHTLIGRALRACAYDAEAAQLLGIRPGRMGLYAFGLAAALGAIAGIVTTPLTNTSYDVGIMFGLKGMVAAIIGGWTMSGLFIGGLALGILESLGAGFVSTGFKDAFALLLLVAFLLLKTTRLLKW